MNPPLTLADIKAWAHGIAESQGTATEEEELVAFHIRNPVPRKVESHILAAAEARGIPRWIDADSWLPESPRCVLATDLEAHFIACWTGETWENAWTEEPIDSQITHWMDLIDPPEA